ncbi:hypothetical protein [Tunturiibacter gelidiferens]|uniref:hypothetical protein n=1 Tax=Tunturiibacter gelidiferens TaxID=3069689 RepID=UPI003D9B4BEA
MVASRRLVRLSTFASRSFSTVGCRLSLAGGPSAGGFLLAALALSTFGRAGGGGGVDDGDDPGADGGAEAGAGVPPGAGGEAGGRAGVVGAGGDVVECGFAFGGVDGGLYEAGGGSILCVGYGDEAGPERRYGAGAADGQGLAVDADDVAGGGVGVA